MLLLVFKSTTALKTESTAKVHLTSIKLTDYWLHVSHVYGHALSCLPSLVFVSFSLTDSGTITTTINPRKEKRKGQKKRDQKD